MSNDNQDEVFENERQALPQTKSNATLKAVLAAAGFCFIAGVGATLYLADLLSFSPKEKKEEKSISHAGYLVKPQYEKPKKEIVAYAPPAKPEEPQEDISPLEFHLPKLTEEPPKKQEGLFDDLLPTINKEPETIVRPDTQTITTIAQSPAEPAIDEGYEKWKASVFSPFANSNDVSTRETVETDKSRLQIKLSSTQLEQREAGRMDDLTYTMPEGTLIPCVLNTSINTNVHGYIKCTVTDDVYGYDGNLVLIYKGAQVHGEYNSGLELGVDRLFVKWTRLRMPTGILIDLDSPGVGNLGEAGLGGEIDHRYWRRFGGALLVSLINDSIADDNKGRFKTTRNQVQTSAEKIIEKYADIPPIMYKHRGEEALIYVAKDLSFKGVYGE